MRWYDILPTGIICAFGNEAKIVQQAASLLGNAATGCQLVVGLRPAKEQFMTVLSIFTSASLTSVFIRVPFPKIKWQLAPLP